MTDSVHSFKFNVDANHIDDSSIDSLRDQVNGNADENVTYSIFLNESDLALKTRNGGISNINDQSQKKLKSSRLYKFILSTDEVNSNEKNVAKNDSKNYSSLITLSTGVLNSVENSGSDINILSNSQIKEKVSIYVSKSINSLPLVDVYSSPLDNLIQTSDEYFTAISSSSPPSKIQGSDDMDFPLMSSTPRHNRFINKDSPSSRTSKYKSLFNKNNQMNTKIDEAVELLRNDYIAKPQTIKIRSEPSLSSIDFEPHDFRITKRFREKNKEDTKVSVDDQLISNRSTEYNSKMDKIGKPLKTSLFNNIIVPSNKDDSSVWNPYTQNIGDNVKTLDNVDDPLDNVISPIDSSSEVIKAHFTSHLQNDHILSVDIPNIINSDFKPQNTLSSSIVTSVAPQTQISSVADLPPSPTYESANDNISGEEDNYVTWNEYNSFPIQHIDSSSIKSFDLVRGKEYDEDIDTNLFSLMRILMLMFIGIMIPPIFFLVAFGENSNLLSDYVLLKLIIKRSKKVFLLQGFIWDIDLQWLRRLCLWLGIMELFFLLACIAIGFSVGLTQ